MDERFLKSLHNLSYANKKFILLVDYASCFYCKSVYASSKIKEFIVEKRKSKLAGMETALCPKCGVDTVIPGIISIEALEMMYQYWFKTFTAIKTK